MVRWDLIEADLHEHYGIDLDEPALRGRSYRWLRCRVLGLLSMPPRFTPDGDAVPATRLGLYLFPPKPKRRR